MEVPRRQRKRHARHDAVNRPHPAIVGKTIFASTSAPSGAETARRNRNGVSFVVAEGYRYAIRLASIKSRLDAGR